MKTANVLLYGAGNRGIIYGRTLERTGKIRIAGIIDPSEHSVSTARRQFKYVERIFPDFQQAVSAGLTHYDGIIIATPDEYHAEEAIVSVSSGLKVLLEKPAYLTADQKARLLRAEQEAGKGSIVVCHVLRYSDFFRALKKVIDDGLIGTPEVIYHTENISYYHYAHSYIRGNWPYQNVSPIILAKSSHDLDLICWYTGLKPVSVTATGSRSVFLPQNAPGDSDFCHNCNARNSCLYEAEDLYIKGRPLIREWLNSRPATLKNLLKLFSLPAAALTGLTAWKFWPTDTIGSKLTKKHIRQHLKDSRFGQCVYRLDADQFEKVECLIQLAGEGKESPDSVRAVFRINAPAPYEGRTIRIDGTNGSVRGVFSAASHLTYVQNGSAPVKVPVRKNNTGHSHADTQTALHFADVLLNKAQSQTTVEESALSHDLAFACHRSATCGGQISGL